MTVLDDLGAWLQTQLDAARTAGAASRQGEVDAAAAALATVQAANAGETVQIAQLTAQLAALQARYDAYVKVHPDTNAVIGLSDFATSSAAMLLGKTSLTTPGVYRMPPKSTVKVAPTAVGSTNPLYLMRGGGNSTATAYPGLEYGGFTLEGTDQGATLYNGFFLGYSVAARFHDVKITGIPGNSSGPPGETFSLNLWHTKDASLSNVTLDGRRDGTPVAATMLGYNFTTGTTTCDNLTAQYALYGFAAAMWQCVGAQVFNRCVFSDSRKGINIEQTDGGSYDFNGCTFHNLGAPYVAQVSAKPAAQSAVVTFRDPVVDAWPLKVRTYPNHDPQKDSDIRCVIAGQDVTADPSRFLIVHTG